MLYSHIHGYPFYFYHTSLVTPELSAGWSKLLVVKRFLPQYEWIFWMDLDSIVTNYTIRAEDLIEIAETYKKPDQQMDFIIAEDWNNINSGMFIIRNCEWSMNFLQTAFEYSNIIPNHTWGDQEGIIRTKDKNPEDWDAHVVTVSLRLFNAYDFPETRNNPKYEHTPGDFALHLPGITNAQRMPFFERYLKRYPAFPFNQYNGTDWRFKIIDS